ncbi:MAG: MEDS domain-containing protein [Haloferacaceae archaeon]
MSGDLRLDPDAAGSRADREWLDTTTGHAASNDHLALVYADQREQLATVAAYVRDGIARNERCVYVADDNSTRAVRAALGEAGIDVEAACDAGALDLYTAEETYLGTGSFDRSTTVEFFTDALSRAHQNGFDGLRTATEMTWALDAGTDLDALVSCEHGLNEHYVGEDYTALCQYNRNRFPRETVEAVVRAHPLLVEDMTVDHNDRYRPVRPDADPDDGSRGASAAPTQSRDAAAPRPSAPSPSAAPRPSDAPVRVLLVDDDPGYAEMVSEYLEASDAVDVAVPETDPQQAVPRLEDGSFDCVVSDYEMPRLDGLELLELVREEHPALPFLMLTARGDEATAVDAISAGVTDYFRKGGGTDQYATLAHRISSVVSRYRAEREAAATRRQYARLAEESTDVIAVLDERWRIEYLSPAAERQFGHPPEALVGDVVFDHIHSADRDAALTRFESLIDDSRGSVAAEFRVRHRDGSWLWVEARGRNLLDDPDVRGVVVHLRDVSERKERQRELRRSERRFRSLFEEAFDAMVITDEDGRCVDANSAACELFDLPCDQFLGRPLADFVSNDHGAEWLRRIVQGHDQTRATVPLSTAAGTRRVVDFAATPHVVPGRHLFVLRDVTDRERYEQTLAALHDSSREFLVAESRTDATETLVDAATNVLSMSVVAVYLFDDGMLAPAAVSDGTVDASALEALAPRADSAVGTAFVDGEPRSVRADATAPPLDDLPLVDGVVVPLGDHGACVVGDTEPGLGEADRDLIETLAATAETALDRVDRGAELRERTAELQSQNDRLEQLRGLNATVREIGEAIAQADTRPDIERAVCRHLSTVDGVALVRISGYDQTEERLVPRESEGRTRVEDWPDGPIPVDDSTDPAAQAVVAEESVYVPNTAEEVQMEPWCRRALANGLRSVVSLPLTHRHISYGTLTVYAEQTGFFGELVRLALADLGRTVATVMNAVKQQNALLSGTVNEVTVRFTDERIPLHYVASRLDCTLALETVAPQPGGDTLKRVRVTDGDAAAVVDTAAEIPAVSDAALAADADGDDVVDLWLANRPLADYLADRGVRVLGSVVDAESATVTLAVPDTVDVRTLLESLAARYGNPTLVSKSERDAAVDPDRCSDTGLTSRQREVVRTAHAEGFFESPRECAAEDVADALDISPQTFYRHVRTAERKLFDAVFGPRGE